jgi:hypothetical protein
MLFVTPDLIRVHRAAAHVVDRWIPDRAASLLVRDDG